MPRVKRLVYTLTAGDEAGFNASQTIYRTNVNCDDTGMPFRCCRCDSLVMYDCYYCPLHLAEECGVRVGISKTGFGLGLFATRDFKRRHRVAHYGGEILTPAEIDARYGWLPDDSGEMFVTTAPYALGLVDSENVRDAARIRGAGAYCNDPRNTPYKANAALGCRYIRAVVDVKKGEEVFVDYGEHYWTRAGVIRQANRIESCKVSDREPMCRQMV